jgi:sterol desaturase/sphingolipid hydroxylase (fatty acid hydroxylase superfamily)
MSHVEINRSKEPIRLFKSDLLEFFTHIHPVVVLVIWVPVAGYFLASAILGRAKDASPWSIPIGFLIGLFAWTLAEYVIHRFVFHFRPRAPWQERVSFLFHGVHHAQPMSKTRLVMPPPVSIPLALLFYAGYYLLLGLVLGRPQWVAPVFSGFITGYLIYDMLHYGTHHFRIRWRWWMAIRKHHMLHHSQTPDLRFGVTSPLWDIVFGTEPA